MENSSAQIHQNLINGINKPFKQINQKSMERPCPLSQVSPFWSFLIKWNEAFVWEKWKNVHKKLEVTSNSSTLQIGVKATRIRKKIPAFSLYHLGKYKSFKKMLFFTVTCTNQVCYNFTSPQILPSGYTWLQGHMTWMLENARIHDHAMRFGFRFSTETVSNTIAFPAFTRIARSVSLKHPAKLQIHLLSNAGITICIQLSRHITYLSPLNYISSQLKATENYSNSHEESFPKFLTVQVIQFHLPPHLELILKRSWHKKW